MAKHGTVRAFLVAAALLIPGALQAPGPLDALTIKMGTVAPGGTPGAVVWHGRALWHRPPRELPARGRWVRLRLTGVGGGATAGIVGSG